MKLRNKKTGEVVVEVNKIGLVWNRFGMPADIGQYDSLAELNEEWEDYEPDEKKTRRYRLMKDLPTFKAGEIFELFDGNLYKINESDDDDTEYDVMAYHAITLKRFPNILKDWFEPIDDEDINVTNIHPLIKDKKIRKVVRAWAKINAIEEALYTERLDRSLCQLMDMGDYDFDIQFVGWIPTLKEGEGYTIAELCGEEEE